MKNILYRLLNYLVGLSCVFLSSCTITYIFPTGQTTMFPLSQVRGKKIVVLTSPKVVILEFKKTYEKAFSDNSNFADFLTNQWMDSLSRYGIDAIHSKRSLKLQEFEKNGSFQALNRKVIFENDTLGPDYLVYISRVEINNQWLYTARAPIMMAGGGMMYGGGGSSEQCVVSFYCTVYDLTTGNSITEFKAVGDHAVAFFDYDYTLKIAIRNAVHYAISYMKTGKVKYMELF